VQHTRSGRSWRSRVPQGSSPRRGGPSRRREPCAARSDRGPLVCRGVWPPGQHRSHDGEARAARGERRSWVFREARPRGERRSRARESLTGPSGCRSPVFGTAATRREERWRRRGSPAAGGKRNPKKRARGAGGAPGGRTIVRSARAEPDSHRCFLQGRRSLARTRWWSGDCRIASEGGGSTIESGAAAPRARIARLRGDAAGECNPLQSCSATDCRGVQGCEPPPGLRFLRVQSVAPPLCKILHCVRARPRARPPA
jgi:hypothetical protein